MKTRQSRLRLKFAAVLYWLLLFSTLCAKANEFEVQDSKALLSALGAARAGDRVVLLPGHYSLGRFESRHGGTKDAPIVVTAKPAHGAVIEAARSETFVIRHPYWRFEKLVIDGTDRTDHAFHISDDADGVIIRNNRLIDFHSHIKINGVKSAFPDQGLIAGNEIFNRAPRITQAPVTPIDVVGGHDWVVRDNVVRDFGGSRPDQIAYGIFLKGNSRNGLIERNLVICSANHEGGWRLGISLGGGGTGDQYCEQKDCDIEHRDGMIRNNIVLNCSSAGIYIKRSVNSHIFNNTLLLTEGIDVQLAPASATIRNNYLDGAITARKGATIEKAGNRLNAWGLFPRPTAAASYLAHRISDYHIKYPSVFSAGFIQTVQEWIEAGGRWLADSRLGLGHAQTLNDFPGLALGELTPSDPALLRAETDESPVGQDFWGNLRNPDVSFLGAIDPSVSPCDVRLKSQPEVDQSRGSCVSSTFWNK